MRVVDGAIDRSGAIAGTMLHGIFENEPLRTGMLRRLRERRGLAAPVNATGVPAKQAEYDRLEATLRSNIDVDLLWRLARLKRR